jgi:hypothetical protein
MGIPSDESNLLRYIDYSYHGPSKQDHVEPCSLDECLSACLIIVSFSHWKS